VQHSTLITPSNLHITSPLAIQNNKRIQNQTNNNAKELTYASLLECATFDTYQGSRDKGMDYFC
jgi:hypothetical protein